MKCIIAFLLVYTVSIIKVNAQNISNEGTEFWLCFPSHVPAVNNNGPQLALMSVFITSKNNTSGVVTCGTFSQPFTVMANNVTEVPVPRANSYIFDGSTISINKGIKVAINAGQPKAVVYGHVFAGARSAASLVLPVGALGQKYYAVSYNQSLRTGGSQSQFQVVCVEPNTVLNITPRINGVVQPTFQQTLVNVGDVYQYQNNNDITGTFIEVETSSSSCKRFAAFSGSSALAIFSPGCVPPGGLQQNSNPSYDPLFQQLYPLESWGNTFPLIPFTDRNTGAIFRVLASENGTIINVDGFTTTINAGTFYETLPINRISVITANKPVTVTQYALTQFCADSRNRGNNNFPSDPDMVIINPLEYSIKNVTMYSSTKLAITDQFLNVMIPNTGLASFRINGVSRSNLFSPVPNNTVYSYAQINLRQISSSTNFNLTSDVGFNAIAYGFGDFESYAYSAGTNLASSVFINAVRPVTNEIITNACRDENFDFRLVLPYLSTKLVWTLDAGDAPITQEGANLKPTPVTINGRNLFEYRLPISKIYITTGIKNIRIISTIPPTAGGCPSGDELLNFEFLVEDPPPLTTFKAVDKACINSPVSYTLDQNNSSGPVLSYFWDFGDGTPLSSEKNPVHTFASTGTFNVSLFVKNDIACVSRVSSLPIEIFAQPVANFSIANISCAGEVILFNNQTVINGNTGISYSWDFGDGSTSTAPNPTHIYKTPATYNVTLTLKTAANCEAVITKIKVINASPNAEIEDPEACVNDNVTFQIINKSTDIASYEWDFGDGTNDISQKNRETPSHKYNSAGIYNVKLKLGSSNNCQINLIKTITISGANPKAEFQVLNPANLCNNVPVQFKDLSTIPFGNITKLEWVFNFTNGGLNKINTIDNPTPKDIYEFKYPASKDNLNYQIKLRAYSGNLCFIDFGPITITVKGSPEVVFNPIANLCLDAGAVKLSQASDISGISGTGVYSGIGVTPSGFFDPVLAGSGTFNITYTFTATNGCSDTKIQSITVFESPLVNAGGEEVVILNGGQVTLNGTATGRNLTYKWSPSKGLNRDDILNPIASPNETTLYTLLVTSSDGCTALDAITVNVVGFPEIPNTFTPNNDAINDTWNIKYLETYVNGRVTIFNRYGTQVFTSIGYNIPWDGKTNGKDVPVATYYYIIDPRNGAKNFSGSVTVIR